MKKALTSGITLALLWSVGCAQERPPIDRVQANAMPKSFFVGDDLTSIADDPEFYMHGTVIDVGYGASQDGLFTSTYAQPVSRVRWEITEDFLNARLAYERIEGTDGKGDPIEGLQRKTSNDGQVVASYRIRSHFDISPVYNPTTGEELNIIEENTYDRPWYERSHLRVDWSMNYVVDAYEFDTLAMIGIYGGVTYEPLAFTVHDPSDENAPVFVPEEGYFDVTNKVFARPQVIDLSSLGWGIDKFPSCWLPGEFAGGTEPVGNCNPVELTLRQSFKKVVDKDYVPFDYDGLRFQAFGIFNFSWRYGYERNYGMVDNRWFRFAARYNLWERGHYYDEPEAMAGPIVCASRETTEVPTGNPEADPNRDVDGNGTADECEEVTTATGFAGSQCDIHRGMCTLPFAARKAVTIPWYVGGNDEEDLFEATTWSTAEWDLALKAAIQTARLVECRRTGTPDCWNNYPMWSGQQDDYDDAVEISKELDACRRTHGWNAGRCLTLVDDLATELVSERGDADQGNAAVIAKVVKLDPVLMLCHNPVRASDHPACGKEGLKTRLGDLRYNSVLIWDKPQSPSPWGIMVDSDDPVTGEKIASSINVWNHVTDLAVQGVVDLVRYANGELSTADITNGDYIYKWAQASKLSAAGTGPTMSKREINQRLSAATSLSAEEFEHIDINELDPTVRGDLHAMHTRALDAATRAGIPSRSEAAAHARMAGARGTPVESELMNPGMLQLAGIPGELPVEGPVADAASPLALNTPKIWAKIRNLQQLSLAERGACILHDAPEPTGLTGIADILLQKFPAADAESPSERNVRYQRMHRYLARRFHYSVIAHEMGHSVGHRHNFVSSSAPLFYRPQYWQLRTSNGTITAPCDDAVSDGGRCVGPRYFDPLSEEEQRQMIWMFQQSSVMEYPGDYTQDMLGLGIWDFAATRMFYGDTAAVYTAPDIRAASDIGVGITNATDTFGGLIGIKYSKAGAGGTEDFHYSQLQNEYDVLGDCYEVVPRAPSYWRDGVDGRWNPILDGKVVKVNGEFTKCRQMPVDYVAWNDMRMPTEREIGGGYYRGGVSVDPQNRLRVPYGFATDSWADLGNASVYRHDNGGDPYEIAMFLIHNHENRHILDNFRRNRTTFNVRAAADRAFGRYNEKLLGLGSGIGFFANIYENFAANQGYTFDTIWPYIVDSFTRENMVAASVVFDHFARQLARPSDGEHYLMADAFNDPVLRSAKDADGNPSATVVVVPNGSSGYLRDVGFGGRPLENALSEDHGDFDTSYTMNAGSYYEKINVAILLSESEDRFISQSRSDFYDARFRAAGMADVFPDGWRRLIGNALTSDRSLLAPRVAADAAGMPILNTEEDPLDPMATMFPDRPLGWVSWWPKEGPQICFPSNGRMACSAFDGFVGDFDPDLPEYTAPVDPQVGWESQKFLIAWTLAYIPANQRTDLIDMMRIYRLGLDSEPAFENRIEWQDPSSGQIYYARTYGKECLFGSGATCTGGKLVEKGIAARILEHAGALTASGYQLDEAGYPGGRNAYGRPMVIHHPDGTPVVKADPALVQILEDGRLGEPPPDCDQNVEPDCTQLNMHDNHFAWELAGYKSVPDYLWEVMVAYNLATPAQLGLYP